MSDVVGKFGKVYALVPACWHSGLKQAGTQHSKCHGMVTFQPYSFVLPCLHLAVHNVTNVDAHLVVILTMTRSYTTTVNRTPKVLANEILEAGIWAKKTQQQTHLIQLCAHLTKYF